MAKKTGELKMGKTCTTCKFAVFGSNRRNYGFGSKKQTGFCIVNADPPEVPQRPNSAPHTYAYYDAIDSDLYDRLKKDDIPEKEPYLTKFVENYYKSYKNFVVEDPVQKNKTAEQREELVVAATNKYAEALSTYYDKMVANYIWWRENWDSIRLCHRATTCDRWTGSKNNRESWAKGIVSGKIKKGRNK